jgi:hypothetical protein
MKKKFHMRPILINGAPGVGRRTGYFHKWCEEPFMYDPAESGLKKTYALVELLDGTIKFIEPEYLKFTEVLYDDRKQLPINL